MKLHDKITYRGWIATVRLYNGWQPSEWSGVHLLRDEDVKLCARLWLTMYRRSYLYTYLFCVNRLNRGLNAGKRASRRARKTLLKYGN